MTHTQTVVIEKFKKSLLNGNPITFDEACQVADYHSASANLQELLHFSTEIRQQYHGNSVDLCSIVNAKSGKCSENCKFCAQSSHYNTSVETYELVDQDFALTLAKNNDANGVGRFSLVTAGKAITLEQLKALKPIYEAIKEKTTLSLCASMGMLTQETASYLKEIGVSRYHCNLETSKSYFPEVCTTHTWQEKVETIQCARNVGMDVCSGGIIGLGETRKQRIELAFELRELDIRSIPINVLNPIKNTPFENFDALSFDEVLLTFAMFILINPLAVIRSAGGRNLLGDQQEEIFKSGASGAIVGDYLTTSGEGLQNDLEMFKRLGLKIRSVQGDK